MRNSLVEIQRAIQVCKKTESECSLELGRKREQMVADVLLKLKSEGLINTFFRTANLGWLDVMRGVDFYVIYITDRYRVCPLSVTGRGWVNVKKRRHPENQVIYVDLEETQESIKNKIIRAIAAQEN